MRSSAYVSMVLCVPTGKETHEHFNIHITWCIRYVYIRPCPRCQPVIQNNPLMAHCHAMTTLHIRTAIHFTIANRNFRLVRNTFFSNLTQYIKYYVSLNKHLKFSIKVGFKNWHPKYTQPHILRRLTRFYPAWYITMSHTHITIINSNK